MSAAHDVATTVTREQREKFERDGYLVIDGTGCQESVLDAITADLDGLYEGQYRRGDDGVFYSKHRIADAWKISESVADLALSTTVFAVLEGLYGRRPLPLHTLNFRVGTEQAPHSDTYHFNAMPAGFMCGVWVALEDIHPNSGPIVFYPGSHRLPEVTPADVGSFDEDEYTEHIAGVLAREKLEPHYAVIRKGQAFIWAANLLHGGSPRKNPRLTRNSQVTHYFFEGCRYYTPRLTTHDEVHWRHPGWVSREPDRELNRIRKLVEDVVPEGATVLMVSRGDDRLLELDQRYGWHFPRDESGAWAGHHPADSDEAIARLEELRAEGAEYLVFPDSALWWLEHYSEFAQHLYSYEPLVHETDCAVFALRRPAAAE